MTVLWFIVAAGFGAALRHRINEFGHGWRGTLCINVVGSFALGWILASGTSPEAVTVFGTGMCGAFTTFSTFSLETVESPTRQRVVLVCSTITLGLLAAFAGHQLS